MMIDNNGELFAILNLEAGKAEAFSSSTIDNNGNKLVSVLHHWSVYYNTGYIFTTLVIVLQHWLKYSEIKLNGIPLIKLRIGS